jgi:hypothetical protein
MTGISTSVIVVCTTHPRNQFAKEQMERTDRIHRKLSTSFIGSRRRFDRGWNKIIVSTTGTPVVLYQPFFYAIHVKRVRAGWIVRPTYFVILFEFTQADWT